jgi:hypothetical protein
MHIRIIGRWHIIPTVSAAISTMRNATISQPTDSTTMSATTLRTVAYIITIAAEEICHRLLQCGSASKWRRRGWCWRVEYRWRSKRRAPQRIP